ncbi:MAG TPA: response regulator transcription factor [Clostridia bacterium]|nr:response regulator transcription factor [Clostridia bacterium]
MGNKLIYVVDDEERIRELIKSYLLKESFTVEVFENGRSAYECFLMKPPDMFIIDIMMPGMDGYALCREIRKTSDVPVIMVSAKDDEVDRVLGLEMGSDDYISKPFSPRELVARVKTIFRRVKQEPEKSGGKKNQIECSDITVYPDERRMLKEDRELDLTSKEYDFLFFLIKNKNKVFKREQLINSIWGYDYIGDTRAIDDLVKRVRKKMLEIESKLEIVTVWGYGYKISE